MKNATLLVVVGKNIRSADLARLGDAACAQNLHLIVLILGIMPTVPVYAYGIGEYGAYAVPASWQDDVEKSNTDLAAVRQDISQYLADLGASADVRAISGEPVTLTDAMESCALTCDMIAVGDDLRQQSTLFSAVLRTALFRTPAGVLLNSLKSAIVLQPKSVFLAWKAGLPASRAVHGALPILRAAQNVTVALFDPTASRSRDGVNPGSDVATWLTHHGCTVTVQQYPSGGEEIGTAIRKRAMETGADLVVMGGYDHSRLREVVFGGTTRSMIEQHDIPVLLYH